MQGYFRIAGSFTMKPPLLSITKNSVGDDAINNPARFLYRLIAAVLLPVLSACTNAAGDIANARLLLAPPGYYQPIAVTADKKYECPDFPEPHTGPLVFASKYEGDDSSKSHLNKE